MSADAKVFIAVLLVAIAYAIVDRIERRAHEQEQQTYGYARAAR